MPGRISPCPVTGCSSFSAIVEFRAPHLERGENTRAAVSTTINHSVFRSSLPTTILSLSLSPLFLLFFFLPAFRPVFHGGVGGNCSLTVRTTSTSKAGRAGGFVRQAFNEKRREVSTSRLHPLASFCFNPLRSTLSATTHTNTCQRRVRCRNRGIYDQFYSRLFSFLS